MSDVKLWCQLFIVLRIGLSFFAMVHTDIHGAKERKPKGFAGFIATFIATGLVVVAYYFAGCFTTLLP
jgi:hypothetical protein